MSVPSAVLFGLAGPVLSDAERLFFRDCDPAGFILFQRNCESPEQLKRLTGDLRDCLGRGDIPILADDFLRIEAMVKALHEHDTAADLLYARDGQAELSAFAEVDGVPCRARFDRLIPGVVIDLKSTSAKPGGDSLARAVVDYGYETSAAHYLAVADALGLDVQAFCLIFVTKTEPYRVTVADLDATFLERGRALRAKAIERALNPTADAYEGATGFLTIGCPRWARVFEEVA